MTFQGLLNSMRSAWDSNVVKLKVLPALLIYCTAIKRGGISESNAAANQIEKNRILGINVGPNPDGSPNIVNQHDYALIKSVFDELRNNGVVHVAIPKGSIVFQGMGENAGGPVEVIGYNIKDITAFGLIR